MSAGQKVATVFGGTGFVGRHVVRELAKQGCVIKVATRVPERAHFLKPAGSVGQIVPVACRAGDPDNIRALVKGSDYVVNCVGILFEKGKSVFQSIHVDFPASITRACTQESVRRFVHISALGIEGAGSRYARTKLEGEKAVRENFPQATILRPSVIFGEDDRFFNMFARMAQIFPALPLIGGGKTRFQPVYVGDVADAVMKALTLPRLENKTPLGRTYELGGPEIVTFREIYERLFDETGQRRCLVSLPFGLAKMQAAFLSLLPRPPLTPDQVESLKTDNIVAEGALTLKDLGIRPTAMSIILPQYLVQYRVGGRFAGADRA